MKKYLLIVFLILFSTISLAKTLPVSYSVQGVTGPVLTNVEAMLDSKIGKKNFANSEEFNKFYNASSSNIKKAIEPYGFFYAQIKSRVYQTNGKIVLRYDIKPGKRFRFQNVDIQIMGEGQDAKVFQDFLQENQIKTGDFFDSTKYEAIKKNFFALATDYGYVSAKLVENQIAIDLSKNIGNIKLHFVTGPRFRIGKINFSSDGNFNEHFLRKFLTFKENDYFSSQEITRSKQNYFNSKLFGNVEILPDYKNENNNQIMINVVVAKKKTKQYSISLGYGTDTDFRGMFDFGVYNISNDAQYVTGDVVATTKKDYAFNLRYVIPGPNPLKEHFDILMSTERLKEAYGRNFTISSGVAYIFDTLGWEAAVKFLLEKEGWKYYLTRSQSDSSQQYNSFMFIPKITFSKKIFDESKELTKGSNIDLFLAGSLKTLGANQDFLMGRITLKSILPLNKRGLFLFTKFMLGHICTEDDFLTQIPLSYWFVMGGNEYLRGYGYHDIGPGKDAFLSSFELRQKIGKSDLYAAIFYDTGNVSLNNFKHLSKILDKKTTGTGFIYKSPIGSFNLYVARTLDGSHHFRVHFGISAEL